MPDLYPTDKEITIFGEKVKYPGLDQNGKFTNGSFTDPKQLASFIPAETLNLILDNLGEAIKSVGLEPNNIDTDQLAKAISYYAINNTVFSERIEKAIVMSQTWNFVTPDENGIIYSHTVDLKQLLADKIRQKKENIKIIDWNIVSNDDNSYSMIKAYNSELSSKLEEKIDSKLHGDFLCVLERENMGNSQMHLGIAIQIADELTEDIKDLQVPRGDGNFLNYTECMSFYNELKKTCIEASQKYRASIILNSSAFGNGILFYPEFYVNAILISSAVPYASSCCFANFVKDSNVKYDINANPTKASSDYFFSECIIDCFTNTDNTAVESFEVDSSAIFNSSSILFHGDKIKINIKLLKNEDINVLYMLLSNVYDINIRYSIIRNN